MFQQIFSTKNFSGLRPFLLRKHITVLDTSLPYLFLLTTFNSVDPVPNIVYKYLLVYKCPHLRVSDVTIVCLTFFWGNISLCSILYCPTPFYLPSVIQLTQSSEETYHCVEYFIALPIFYLPPVIQLTLCHMSSCVLYKNSFYLLVYKCLHLWVSALMNVPVYECLPHLFLRKHINLLDAWLPYRFLLTICNSSHPLFWGYILLCLILNCSTVFYLPPVAQFTFMLLFY